MSNIMMFTYDYITSLQQYYYYRNPTFEKWCTNKKINVITLHTFLVTHSRMKKAQKRTAAEWSQLGMRILAWRICPTFLSSKFLWFRLSLYCVCGASWPQLSVAEAYGVQNVCASVKAMPALLHFPQEHLSWYGGSCVPGFHALAKTTVFD